jgi:hypothetical protein
MALGWREGLVAASALLTLTGGFLPWWEVRTAAGTVTGSAWQVSSRWTAAVVITAVAAVAWLAWRLLRPGASWPVWLAALAAVTLSAFLTLDQRADVSPAPAATRPPAPAATWQPAPAATRPPSPAAFRTPFPVRTTPPGLLGGGPAAVIPVTEPGATLPPRDRLRHYRSPAAEAGLAWGFWASLAAMALTGLSLAAAVPEPGGPGAARGGRR